MRKRLKHFAAGSLLSAVLVGFDPSPVKAQSGGGGGSLGGYGASSGSTGPTLEGGSMIIPYGGKTEGFMPGRMGGGSSLSVRARPSTSMSGSRSSLSLSPLSSEMSSVSSGMRRGAGARPGMSNPLGARGMGLGGSSLRLGTGGGGGLGVMPPRFGYPFRQPPSLLTPGSTILGMSM